MRGMLEEDEILCGVRLRGIRTSREEGGVDSTGGSPTREAPCGEDLVRGKLCSEGRRGTVKG